MLTQDHINAIENAVDIKVIRNKAKHRRSLIKKVASYLYREYKILRFRLYSKTLRYKIDSLCDSLNYLYFSTEDLYDQYSLLHKTMCAIANDENRQRADLAEKILTEIRGKNVANKKRASKKRKS